MTSGAFETTNFDWQVRQLQQQFGEWLERILSSAGAPTDKGWQLPEWVLRGLFWLIVGAIATFLIWQLYRLVRPFWAKFRDSQKLIAQPEAVPLPAVADWLQRSRRAQQQGNYREACLILYGAMLQHLNDQNLIAQAASRTDGEYIALVQMLDRPQPYQFLIRTHEHLCFSKAPASAELFDRCWQAYREIDPAS